MFSSKTPPRRLSRTKARAGSDYDRITVGEMLSLLLQRAGGTRTWGESVTFSVLTKRTGLQKFKYMFPFPARKLRQGGE
jgi:hypothetical protein